MKRKLPLLRKFPRFSVRSSTPIFARTQNGRFIISPDSQPRQPVPRLDLYGFKARLGPGYNSSAARQLAVYLSSIHLSNPINNNKLSISPWPAWEFTRLAHKPTLTFQKKSIDMSIFCQTELDWIFRPFSFTSSQLIIATLTCRHCSPPSLPPYHRSMMIESGLF